MLTPCKVPVELRWTRGDRRCFRLSAALGPDGLHFGRALPFPDTEPVLARFRLPGQTSAIEATLEAQGTRARLTAIEPADRSRLVAYCKDWRGGES